MNSSDSRRPEEWGELYRAERDTFSAYTVALESLLPQLLDKAEIPHVQIEGRTKEVGNFVSKLRRKEGKYSDPLREVTDLAGIRVVLYYLDDVERVGKIIEEQFAVDPANSADKGALMDPDRFGYLSVHHVVRPSPVRSSLPEWTEFTDLCAEIQVRTVLQHAWGAISRKLAYASVREAPRDLQRSLNRLSALLELADDEFVDIRSAREEIEAQYDREVERGNLDLEVDESSLESYVRESGIERRIAELARAAGSPDGGPPDDEEKQEDLRDALQALRTLGINRISELDQRLEDVWQDIPDFMATVNKKFRRSGGLPISDSGLNWLVLVLLWSFQAPAEQFLELRYADALVAAVASTYDAGAG